MADTVKIGQELKSGEIVIGLRTHTMVGTSRSTKIRVCSDCMAVRSYTNMRLGGGPMYYGDGTPDENDFFGPWELDGMPTPYCTIITTLNFSKRITRFTNTDLVEAQNAVSEGRFNSIGLGEEQIQHITETITTTYEGRKRDGLIE